MTRKLRIQYPRALYHLINRGNYGRDLFNSAGEAQAFLDTVLEANILMGQAEDIFIPLCFQSDLHAIHYLTRRPLVSCHAPKLA